MCRALMYLGKNVPVYELLYKTDASLVKQAYDPKQMSGMQNLAGFGMAVWNEHFIHKEKPLLFHSTSLPFYDKNLEHIASQISGECIFAHVRGVPYSVAGRSEGLIISEQNLHPFYFEGQPLALAHNGAISHMEVLKPYLAREIETDYFTQIKGSTDTEWLYALFLSRLQSAQPNLAQMIQAVFETIEILRNIRAKNNIFSYSPINLFISDGKRLIATRYVIDYGHYSADGLTAHSGYHSLWYTLGERYSFIEDRYEMRGYPAKNSIIVSSEPLTLDPSSWIKVPEYSLLAVERDGDTLDLQIFDIQL